MIIILIDNYDDGWMAIMKYLGEIPVPIEKKTVNIWVLHVESWSPGELNMKCYSCIITVLQITFS